MASPVNPPRGMRDLLPTEKARRDRVLDAIRTVYRAHGFDEIETPVLEDRARLTSGLGGDNEKLGFAVLRRGLGADDLRAADEPGDLADLGLRYDLTVPLARFYASHRAELPTVFRSLQIAPVWRAERPQKGRYRQFVQCDIDVIGEAGPLAEMELLTATLAALGGLGLPEARIRVNDRRILRGIVSHLGIPDEAFERALIVLDKEDKIGVDGVVAELRDLGLGDADIMSTALGALGEKAGGGWSLLESRTPAWLSGDARTAYAQLLDIRAAVPDDRLEFSPLLVRGMGYYTGPIFEIAHPAVSYSLGGGGRYDGMIGRFLGHDVPAVGFSLGFERLVELVDPPAAETDGGVALVADAGLDPARLVRLKSEVIATDARVRLVTRAKNVSAQLDALAADGFTRFAFVDERTTSDTLGLRPLG